MTPRQRVVVAILIALGALALVVFVRPTHRLPPAPATLPAPK